MSLLVAFTVIASLATACAAADANDWSSRVIYQVLTDRFSRTDMHNFTACVNLTDYCGGTWQGLQQRFPYITKMNFDAVWISPMVENTQGGYHGYWMKNLYKTNPFFGTSTQLRSLVATAHAQSVYVMLDVVANHVGPVGDSFGQITPFSTAASYHTDCAISSYTCFTPEILHCRLDGLPDLNQSDAFVNATLHAWARDAVSQFAFDGLRIDTVPFVEPSFWASFVAAAGVYAVGETFTDLQCARSYERSALPGVLNYPLTYVVRATFAASSQKMYNLRVAFQAQQAAYRNLSTVANFVESHDIPRFLNISGGDVAKYRNALTYVLFTEGIPIVLYGTEQLMSGGAVPQNRAPLWTTQFNQATLQYIWLSQAVAARRANAIWNYPQIERFVNDNVYIFSRGDVLVVTSNVGERCPPFAVTVTYLPSYKPGTLLCNTFDASNCFQVTSSGVKIVVNGGQAMILTPK